GGPRGGGGGGPAPGPCRWRSSPAAASRRDECRARPESQHLARIFCRPGELRRGGPPHPGTASGKRWSTGRAEEDVMHPMFVKLFLEPDADDLLADEEERRRHAKLARQTRSRMTMRVTARPQDRRPRR